MPADADNLARKLAELKELYKTHLISCAKKIHSSILTNYNAASSAPDYMEQVENGILEIENILNSELSGSTTTSGMEYINNDHEAFDKAFDRVYTLFGIKDSCWLGQLGSFACNQGSKYT